MGALAALVPGRGPRRPEGRPRLQLDAGWRAPAHGGRRPHVFTDIFEAICPDRATGAAIMPYANTEAMKPTRRRSAPRSRRGLTHRPGLRRRRLASARQEACAPRQHHPLSPHYSPELNPLENVWALLRQNKLCATVWNNCDGILDASQSAWRFLIKDPDRIRSIGHRKWAALRL